MISLDGYFAGEDGNIDWHQVDREFDEFAVEQTESFGALMFGRTTYELFEEFWPTVVGNSEFSPADRKIGKKIDDVEKFVFSKTLKKVTWKNATLFKEIDPKIVKKLIAGKGGDIAIFGSGTIVQQLTNLGLIDEYRLMVNPVILGQGKPMFNDLKAMHKLKLLDVRKFGNGNVMLTYKSA